MTSMLYLVSYSITDTTNHYVCAKYNMKYWCATALKEDGITYSTWDYCDPEKCPNQGTLLKEGWGKN